MSSLPLDDLAFLNTQPRNQNAHRTALTMGISDMATDYYASAKTHFDHFLYDRHDGDPVNQFTVVVDFFSLPAGGNLSIQHFLDRIKDNRAVDMHLTQDKVLRILGIWLCVPGLGRIRRKHANTATDAGDNMTCASANSTIDIYSTPIRKLIKYSLPPPIDWARLEEFEITKKHLFAKSLNGKALRKAARLDLRWTRDITEHLQLENHTLKLFQTAGFCYYANYCSALSRVHHFARAQAEPAGAKFPKGFTEEVSRTFELLFGSNGSRRVLYEELIKHDESLRKYRGVLGQEDVTEIWTCDWNKHASQRPNYLCDEFPYFGQRLRALETILQEAKPTSLMQLFRDSRNKHKYWTFIATILVLLFGIVSLFLQAAQTLAAWMQYRKG